ncbi:MoaD/ThiS family protein [Halalkalicoccus jeotgali]|uniref:Sulfur transfer protein ThiS n=1 Tax=Halalkalicoccus jeotgali (strain DSM 18796 / CECT 7217 / JCM 14584 / KCTC 4019 / B3) TaxID=795797 RepID=D8J9D5_HALJB|nr:MoaD/ThiS family protein [Halalkalicoccus jeotgali]ADJ14347.1 thiamineS protein [Halalkalicoccus jeotgali B3]ELY40610.1 sulfur transfer protein ThiS [Halalkalicoccus jeotgali B3]
MQIECRFYGPFREAVGEKRVVHETAARTVGELLEELSRAYPALDGRLVADGIAGSTVVTKGNRDVRHLEGTGTELEGGDVIRLTPSVYGG